MKQREFHSPRTDYLLKWFSDFISRSLIFVLNIPHDLIWSKKIFNFRNNRSPGYRMWIVCTAVIVFCLKGRSVAQCGGQVWKKVDIPNDQLAGWFSALTVKSIKDCGEHCTRESQCRSFGVDVIDWNCFLYNHLVWAGGQVMPNGPSLLYYWEYQKVCPDGYTYEESIHFCYKFSSDEKEWLEALNTCKQDNGLLVMADNPVKSNFINHLVRDNGNPHKIYVGATDKNNEGNWRWFNGVPVTEWNPNEPNNYDQLQHCGVLTSGAKVDDEYCDREKFFICEIPMV